MKLIKPFVLVLLLSFPMTACVEDGDNLKDVMDVKIVCIEHVKYWMVAPLSQSQAISPAINPKTMTFEKCLDDNP